MAELQILKVGGYTGVLDLQILKVSGTITPFVTANLQILKVSGIIAGSPVANAGPDVTTDACLKLTIDGTGTLFGTGPDWDQVGGPAVVINDGDTLTPWIITPASPDGTTITLELTLANGSKDQMSVTTGPHQFWRLSELLVWKAYRKVTL